MLAGALALAVVQAQERRLATIPEGFSLEGKPMVSPDGATTVPNVQRVRWSADGAHVGYVGLKGETPYAVLDETAYGPYHWVSGPEFGGGRWAFRVGKSVGKDRERWWVLHDGEETDPQDWIGAVVLSPADGEYVAWTQPGARVDSTGAYATGKQTLVTPWKKGAAWEDATSLLDPRFARDGSFVSTLAMKAGTWRVLIADKRGERELGKPGAWIADWDVAADGKAFALAIADPAAPAMGAPPPGLWPGRSKMVIQFGKRTFGAERDNASSPALSPNGKQVAYVATKGGLAGVAIDEGKRASLSHSAVPSLVWRPDGKELACVHCDGGSAQPGLMSVSGEPVWKGGKWGVARVESNGKEAAEGRTWAEIADLTYSADGARLAFAARGDGGWRIVCGALESEAFDEVGEPRFAADGKSIGFGARVERELYWKVLALE
jgi:hypothetical protein